MLSIFKKLEREKTAADEMEQIAVCQQDLEAQLALYNVTFDTESKQGKIVVKVVNAEENKSMELRKYDVITNLDDHYGFIATQERKEVRIKKRLHGDGEKSWLVALIFTIPVDILYEVITTGKRPLDKPIECSEQTSEYREYLHIS